MTPGVLCLGCVSSNGRGDTLAGTGTLEGRQATLGTPLPHGSYFYGIPAAKPGKLRDIVSSSGFQRPPSLAKFTFCAISSSFPPCCLQGQQLC